MTLEEEEMLREGVGGPHDLQRLHVLVNPGGLFLQAGDGIFGVDQSTVNPALGKNGRQVGQWVRGSKPQPQEKV